VEEVAAMTDIQAELNISPPPNKASKILFTVEEVAQFLDVSPTWIYERTRKKTIPFRKLGKYIRFTKADLEAIIEANRCGVL
jgi:excisionase family DNA binding protein